MEAENDETTKRHDTTFSLHNILFIVHVSAGLAVAGYCGYPTIINLLEGFILWFGWFRLVLRNIFFIFIILNALIGSLYFTFRKATEKKKKPSLYDEYITAVPSVARSSPEASCAPMEVGDYGGGGGGYYFNSCCVESVQPFQAVNTVEESQCYERVVMETNSRSYRRMTSSEKKMKKTRCGVEYQRAESQRVVKTASCRSQEMMDGLSSEEFRMTVETFIMEKKKMYNWQNGVSQFQNGGVDHHWQNDVPQLQNGGVDHWQNGYPQLQNGGFEQWQNCVPQLQGPPDYGGRTGRRHRGRRLVGGSGSTSSHGPCLAISNYSEAAM